MGTIVQKISDKVSLVASSKTWIESLAIEQLVKTAELPSMIKVVGMPDLHPGRGYPIGAAFFSKDKIYPALVGNDIGCGMSLWQTSLKRQKLNLDKLERQLKTVESLLDETWQELVQQRKLQKHIEIDGFDTSLGTIGGGNHFAEFQVVDEVVDPVLFAQQGLIKGQVQLLVHSGSRGYGQAILQAHVEGFNHDGLRTDTLAFADYMAHHAQAVSWAELNRELIARRFLAATRASGQALLDINHNFVCAATVDEQAGWLHRKGATPSDKGMVIIPGSRGDYSYLVQPSASSDALYSLAHGAGRKWKRGECQSRLSHKYKKDELYRTALGSRVICGNKELLYDEAPQAYKPCESIIDDLLNAKLITVVARLKPILTFKTQGGC
jgi:release factor H-coupled RctB family protein